MEIKSQLYSYYLEILNEISNYSSKKESEYNNDNYENLNTNKIIEKIKTSTLELINLKVCQNGNDKNHYYQLENYTKKLESDIKLFYHQLFEYKIHNDVLEDKIKMYRMMQEEFEELKEKVKYVGGKFLDNEKKDNEIIIIRQENDILKKEIAKLERINKLNETLKNNYLNKIKELQNEIEQLNKKLESKYNTNNSISNYNNSNPSNINVNNNEKKISKFAQNYDTEKVKNILSNNSSLKNKHNYNKGPKNSFQKHSIYNNKRPSNYNIIKNIYMNSNNNKNIFNSSSISTLNTNLFTSNYNRILSNISQKKTKNSNKSNKKNKFITMKIDKEEDKSLSINKCLRNHNESRFMFRSESKSKKSYNKIINFKSSENYPMSCQNKNSSKMGKALNKKMNYSNNKEHKMKKSNSALNIKLYSK